MATSPAASARPNVTMVPVAGRYVRMILRLEGAAVVALTAVLYGRTGVSWWLFAVLWLLPDLSMLGYLGGPRLGARIYNAIHSYVTPATLAAAALVLHSPALLPYALIWINHIGADRLVGYGLKFPDGFRWTHLGHLGKYSSPTAQTS